MHHDPPIARSATVFSCPPRQVGYHGRAEGAGTAVFLSGGWTCGHFREGLRHGPGLTRLQPGQGVPRWVANRASNEDYPKVGVYLLWAVKNLWGPLENLRFKHCG